MDIKAVRQKLEKKEQKLSNYKYFFENFKKLTREEWQEKVAQKQKLLFEAQKENL